MGANASTCCGSQEAPETEIDLTPPLSKQQRTPRGGQTAKSTDDNSAPSIAEADKTNPSDAKPLEDLGSEAMREFVKRLQEGIEVSIILLDKSRLQCQAKLSPSTRALILTCGTKVRSIPFAEIKSLLHTKEQLGRVENSAGIGTEEACVAVHLTSGNCIPLFFTSEDEKARFVRIILAEQQQEEF